MSATNATTYYELPVFIATDKPAWLTDWNGAMSAIDTAIKEALTAGENAQTTANTATTSIATINDSLTTINTSLTTLTSTVTGLVGSVNTINSLIGNGEPTTSDKTLIGAINEIYGMITGGGGGNEIQAQNVVYDNTTSGLTADDVQEAIDEVVGMISGGSGVDLDLSAHTGTVTVTPASGVTVVSGYTDLAYEFNDDYSLGHINGGSYLTFSLSPFADWTELLDLDCGLPTRTADKVVNYGYVFFGLSGGTFTSANMRIKFKTDGHVGIEFLGGAGTMTSVGIQLSPVLYILN